MCNYAKVPAPILSFQGIDPVPTDDSTWSWGVDSNTYITNENISLMVNKNENNLQSSLAQSARRMYMVNSSDNLVEFKKTHTF